MNKTDNKDIDIIKSRSYVSCLYYGTLLPLRKSTSLMNGIWPLFIFSFLTGGLTACIPEQTTSLAAFFMISLLMALSTFVTCNAIGRHIQSLGYMVSLRPVVVYHLMRESKIIPHIRWKYVSKFIIISFLCLIIFGIALLIFATPMIILEYISFLRSSIIAMGDRCDTPAYLPLLCFLARGLVQFFVVFSAVLYTFILIIMHGSVICDEQIRKNSSL